MSYQFVNPSIPVSTVASLIAGNRLEPRPRSMEFNRSVRAEIRDAAWMLTRQWQMKEFRAEDRGSPIGAQVELQHAPITHLRLGGGTMLPAITAYDSAALPLDALVQAQAPIVDLGLELQMGRHWKRLLQTSTLPEALIAPLIATYHAAFPVAAPASDKAPYSLSYALTQTLPEELAVREVSLPRAIAGHQLYLWLRANSGVSEAFLKLSNATGFSPAAQEALMVLADQFIAWFHRTYTGATVSATGAWSVPDLAYQFSAAVPSTGAAPLVLTGRDHYGQELNWYSVDMDANSSTPAFQNTPDKIITETIQFVPTEIQFAGAPSARWWEFEDRRVDFGQITADSSDMGRMLLQEFMFLYHNDWFNLPYSVPAGSVCSVARLVVTDVFGESYRIEAAGKNPEPEPGTSTPLENDWGQWSLYALSEVNSRQSSIPQLFLPPTAINTQIGPAVEQVYLSREEATNLVWGVEKIIPNGMGRGTDGDGTAARVTEYFRSRAGAPVPLTSEAKLEYKLSTPVAENWIPFIPRPENGLYALEQGAMLRQVDYLTLTDTDAVVQPRTALLGQPADEAYLVHEREVAPTGMRLEGSFRRARWYNGGTVLWYGRNRSIGRSGGSSGLAYDQLIPRP